MTQEEKDLLLKDLSARLPYGVYCDVQGETKLLYSVSGNTIGFIKNPSAMMVQCTTINHIKPYLRPMSSMTEEENYEFKLLPLHHYESYDWLNSHHFDWRGLIKKGLALEAPEEMYK